MKLKRDVIQEIAVKVILLQLIKKIYTSVRSYLY